MSTLISCCGLAIFTIIQFSPPNSPPRAQETLEETPPTDRWKEWCGGGCRVAASPTERLPKQGAHTGGVRIGIHVERRLERYP